MVQEIRRTASVAVSRDGVENFAVALRQSHAAKLTLHSCSQSFFRADHIDGSGVERGFDVHRVIFFNPPNAGATVLRDLIDVGALHQPQADIPVP